MLQLLLEGGEGYEDLAALLAVPVEEVRERAAAALAELAGGPVPPALSDHLLGQADAEGFAAAQAEASEDPDALARVRRLHARLRLLFPAASLPFLPEPGRTPHAPSTAPPIADEPEPEPAPAPADENEETDAAEPEDEPEPAATEDAEPVVGLTGQQKRLLALMTAVALALVVVVLAVSGVIGGGEDNSRAGGETTAQSDPADTALTRAVLRPQPGERGSGLAIFGAIDEQTPVLQVTARGLAPTAAGQEYSIWLYKTDRIALRLAGFEVGSNGRIASQIKLPPEALQFIIDGTLNQVDVSLNRKRDYRQELAAAGRDQRLPQRIGTSVLRGPITGPGLGATG